jgi:hypothetical protein
MRMHSWVPVVDRRRGRKREGPLKRSIGGSRSNRNARGIRLTRWLAVVLVITAVTCQASLHVWAPEGMPTGKTVTAEQLWELFDQALPPDVWVSPLENSEYEVISAKWLRREFLPAVKEQMKMFRGKGFAEDRTAGSCNGFALVCRLMLSVSAMGAHARTPAAATVIVQQEKPFGGLDASKEGHSVVFVLTDEGPWIIEAQSGVYTKIGDYPNRETIKLVSVH